LPEDPSEIGAAEKSGLLCYFGQILFALLEKFFFCAIHSIAIETYYTSKPDQNNQTSLHVDVLHCTNTTVLVKQNTNKKDSLGLGVYLHALSG